MVRYFLAFIFCISYFFYYSQKKNLDSSLTIKGGVDYYLGLQLNDFDQSQVPLFVSHNNLNSGSINLALVEFTYQPSNNFRVQLSPGFGSYMRANYVGENKNLRWIYEGYVGFKPKRKRDEWIDIGVFSSPYTYEFAKTWEQPLFTRSLAPEYVPYYLLGIRYKRKINSKLSLSTYLLNGWQHLEIQQKIPSIGTQLEFTRGKNYLSWTTYQGNEKSQAQSNYGYRFFTELSWIYSTQKYKLYSCGYSGIQLVDGAPRPWGQVNFAAEYQMVKNLWLNGRIEQFIDPHNIQIRSLSNNGFSCSGLSLGIHAKVSENFSIRFESKLLMDNSNSEIFSRQGNFTTLLPLSFFGVNVRF